MMSNYHEKVKEAMVRNLAKPEAPSARALAQDVDISQSKIFRWVQEYSRFGKAGGLIKKKKRRILERTEEEKLVEVLEYERLEKKERGRYIRE